MSRSVTKSEYQELYLASLNDRELKAYHIAKDHLGMSFTMERSNGYKQWKRNRDALVEQASQQK
jgi:hypothetical protein